jgi:hypothetical protein
MVFKINQKKLSLEPLRSEWYPTEIDLEKYLLPAENSETPFLETGAFGESLLFIGQQVKTKQNRQVKRADILALDQSGNAVIIELKRDRGRLGIEKQALQYLSHFSAYQGKNFIERFQVDFAKHSDQKLEQSVRGFIGDDDALVEKINRRSRIILMARSFDRSLFSMGEWLSKNGVAFRCIAYTPFKIADELFISFSMLFDQSPEPLYPLTFHNQGREPGYFWHNIGHSREDWWSHLKEKNQISAGFLNQEGDEGQRILTSYTTGDIVIAYANRYGAIGWGIVENPGGYKLIKRNDILNGQHLHRLPVVWQAVAERLEDGIPSQEVRNKFDIFHPISISVKIDSDKAKRLIHSLTAKFSEQSGI